MGKVRVKKVHPGVEKKRKKTKEGVLKSPRWSPPRGFYRPPLKLWPRKGETTISDPLNSHNRHGADKDFSGPGGSSTGLEKVTVSHKHDLVFLEVIRNWVVSVMN